MKKVLIVLLAALMLLISVAGAESADWTTPYEEPIEVHIAVLEPSNAKFVDGQDYFDNLWWDLFEERYNVKVIVDWSAAEQEYATKLNLAIASGDLPDMFKCNITQLTQLMDAGMLADLTDVYQSTASDSIRSMMESNWDIVETGSRDGKVYAMPVLHYGYECETSVVWVRKDWAEAEGVTGFESIEDIEALMATFKEKYGAEYGMILDKNLLEFFKSAPIFDALPKIWYEGEDGTLVYGSTQPEMKAALAKWAEWYQEGYIRPDFGVLDQAESYEDAYNGKTGICFFYQWGGWCFGQDMLKNQGDDSYFIAFDNPKDADGNYIKYPVAFNNTWYNVCTKDYEHPEVLIKLINAYCDVLNDSLAEGTMTVDEVLPFNTDEMHHVTGPFKVEFASYTDTLDVCNAFATGNEEFHTGYGVLYYTEAKTWADSKEPSGLGRYLQMAEPTSALVITCKHVDRDQIQKCAVWGAKPQELLDYGSTLDDILLEGFSQIIMGNESVDYFDTLVENWKAAGGDIVTAAVNEMYGNK